MISKLYGAYERLDTTPDNLIQTLVHIKENYGEIVDLITLKETIFTNDITKHTIVFKLEKKGKK